MVHITNCPWYNGGMRLVGFIPFLRVLALCEMQTAWTRIWNQFAMSFSIDFNHYTTSISKIWLFTKYYSISAAKAPQLVVLSIKDIKEKFSFKFYLEMRLQDVLYNSQPLHLNVPLSYIFCQTVLCMTIWKYVTLQFLLLTSMLIMCQSPCAQIFSSSDDSLSDKTLLMNVCTHQLKNSINKIYNIYIVFFSLK